MSVRFVPFSLVHPVGAAVVIQKCGTEILQIFLMDQENTCPQSNRVDL